MKRIERRRAVRLPLTFMVRYQYPGSQRAVWSSAPLRNFSRLGVRFISEYPFQVGATVALQLILPTSEQPVWVEARVAWTQPSRLGMTEIGVAFQLADAQTREAIVSAAVFFSKEGQR